MRPTQARLSRWLAGVERKEDGNMGGGAEELNRASLTHSLPGVQQMETLPAKF